MFIVCPHDQLQFFVIFHHFTSTTTMKNPYEPSDFRTRVRARHFKSSLCSKDNRLSHQSWFLESPHLLVSNRKAQEFWHVIQLKFENRTQSRATVLVPKSLLQFQNAVKLHLL